MTGRIRVLSAHSRGSEGTDQVLVDALDEDDGNVVSADVARA